MKNFDKINRNKLKIANKKHKQQEESQFYKKEGYRVISVVHMDEVVPLELSVPYNFMRRDFVCKTSNFLEMSYFVRVSDLLIVTASSQEMDLDHINVLRRFLPATIVVYANNTHKVYAKSISKMLGDVKISSVFLLNNLLKTFRFKTHKICNNRPFMVVQKSTVENGKTILEGYMKKGLVSDKLIINGDIEALVEQVGIKDDVFYAEALNHAEISEDFREGKVEHEAEEASEAFEQEESGETEDACDDPVPFVDLIEKYKDYRGIRDLGSCKFSDENAPEFYRNLKFFNKFTHVENRLLKKERKIPNNQFVRIQINRPIEAGIIVAFNLFEYETHPTMMNYSFSNTTIENSEILIDNGIRIFRTKPLVTENSAQAAHVVNSGLPTGIVSFVAPVTFFSKTAYIYRENLINATELLDGASEKRVFLKEAVLKGFPFKIFKSHTVVKGMFCTADQVRYFSQIKVETGYGNIGFIKKSLGTKGAFKAFFTSPVKHGENIRMRLFKRVFLPQ